MSLLFLLLHIMTPDFLLHCSFLGHHRLLNERRHCILSFQNLTLQENTVGKDGLEYHLSCTVMCDMIPKNKPLKPLILPFLFYNGKTKTSTSRISQFVHNDEYFFMQTYTLSIRIAFCITG